MCSEQTKATLLKDVTAIVKSKADHVQEIKPLKHVDLQQSITDVSTQDYYNIRITVISRITLWAHFSLGIVKFNTLSNPLIPTYVVMLSINQCFTLLY